jgi:5-methylcytosine-specific restriction enzyme subunit McrC
MTVVPVTIGEWDELLPCGDSPTRGLSFRRAPAARALAARLAKSGKLEVQELLDGLSVRSRSFVGTVRLGPLQVTVRPKITGFPLAVLLRYAYELRNLSLYEQAELEITGQSFQDLVLFQLAAEATELLSRGLHRAYQPRRELLASPRGRVDFQRLAHTGGGWQPALPCHHHPRLADCLPNQVLAAGLRFGAGLTGNLELRARLRRLAALCGECVTPIRLDRHVFTRLERETSRLTRTYEPAFRLIEILYRGAGAGLSREAGELPVPGFLFDMNRFFQAVLSRFLHENLDGFQVRDEYRLQGMFAYVRGFNPRHRQAPAPRPDFVVFRDGKVAAILDAKYRDLWEKGLPPNMLYQLALYALSQGGGMRSVVLYPTLDSRACEEAVEVREPVYGAGRARVILRPVVMGQLAEIVSSPDWGTAAKRRREYARYLAFGSRIA